MIETSSISKLTAGDERPPAVVVAVQLPGVTDGELESSITELERLAKTLGLQPVARIVQRRAKLASGVVLGEGKLVELASLTGGSGEIPKYVRPGSRQADAAAAQDDDEHEDDGEASDAPAFETAKPAQRAKVVLVDHDLTPTQQHNLETATGVDVLDRTAVIVEIFHRHAKTREARLQVEVARLRYLAPRLRAAGGGGDRVRGGIGGKGAGESSLELDRRR
ncbi:MAG: GTPase HflX, partial [Kofleriaceae bacterium]